ncbi:hypothetical protein V6183_15270 [Enterobacter hormaechei]|uniref:hypothetical protein n=1 Tax=Enterobacter hormaechei TaxID=158836 RepID=UPI00390647F2
MSVKRYSVNLSVNRRVEVTESLYGSLVKYHDYAALEARCAALAADNAGLKEWSPNPHSASMFEAIEKAEELMDDGMPELAMIEAFEILKMKRTPETDAFLAEVRAQESKRVYESILDNPAVTDMGSLVDWLEQNANNSIAFAAQLRKEAAQ